MGLKRKKKEEKVAFAGREITGQRGGPIIRRGKLGTANSEFRPRCGKSRGGECIPLEKRDPLKRKRPQPTVIRRCCFIQKSPKSSATDRGGEKGFFVRGKEGVWGGRNIP